MKNRFLQKKVVEHFEKSSEVYASHEGKLDSTDIDLINFFHQAEIKPRKILEIGGGSGFLLNQLGKEDKDIHLVNCEISYRAYKQQVDPEIDLIGGNALCLPFADTSFDCIVSKNLFHHLVGMTRKSSKKLTQTAASEMLRVLKNGGYFMIVEEYHEYKLFATLIFYISLIFSMGNIKWDYFDIRPKVVVSFLTPNEIRKLFIIDESRADQIKFEKFYPFNYKKLFMKLFPYIFKMGFLVHIKQVIRSCED